MTLSYISATVSASTSASRMCPNRAQRRQSRQGPRREPRPDTQTRDADGYTSVIRAESKIYFLRFTYSFCLHVASSSASASGSAAAWICLPPDPEGSDLRQRPVTIYTAAPGALNVGGGRARAGSPPRRERARPCSGLNRYGGAARRRQT